MFVNEEIETDESMRDIDLDDVRSDIGSDAVIMEEGDCPAHAGHGHDHEDEGHESTRKNLNIIPRRRDKGHKHKNKN